MTHAYGPHHEEDVPQTVIVRGRGKWPSEHEVPMPAALREQRRQINDRAALAHDLERERFGTRSRLS
jgi:hypothetical protein